MQFTNEGHAPENEDRELAHFCAIYGGGLTKVQRAGTPPLSADDRLLAATTILSRAAILKRYFEAGVKHCDHARALKEAAPGLDHLTSVEAVQEALSRRSTALSSLLDAEMHAILNTAAQFLNFTVEGVLMIALQKYFGEHISLGTPLGYAASLIHERYQGVGAEAWANEPGPCGCDAGSNDPPEAPARFTWPGEN